MRGFSGSGRLAFAVYSPSIGVCSNARHARFLFLVRRVEPWFQNRLKRLVKTPELHFLESGLLGAMRGITVERIARDRAAFGTLL